MIFPFFVTKGNGRAWEAQGGGGRKREVTGGKGESAAKAFFACHCGEDVLYSDMTIMDVLKEK